MKLKVRSLILNAVAMTAFSFASMEYACAQARRAAAAPRAPAARASSTVSSDSSRLTYDLSASVGNYNGASYTELTLGLNWFLQDWMNWRNSVFTRQGTGMDSVQGLDSSLRFMTTLANDDGTFGFDAFAGPGVRMASKDSNAIFGEAGLVFRLGGLRIGAGAKALNYISSNRTDGAGASLPKNDTQYFLILGGSGVF